MEYRVKQFQDLETSKRSGIVWGFFWRGLVATLCSALGGGLIGGLLGLLVGVTNRYLHFAKTQEELLSIAEVLGTCGGIAVAIVVFWFYVAWLFRGRYFGYRIGVVQDEPRT